MNDTRCFKTKYTPHVRQRASAAAAILSRFEAEENFLEQGPDSSEKKILKRADVSQEFYEEYMKIKWTSKKGP